MTRIRHISQRWASPSAGPKHRISPTLRGTAILLCGVASLCIAGCRLAYLPPSAQAPLFTHGGEVSAAVLSGSETFEGQVAYSPIDHFGVLGSVMYDHGDSGTTANRYRYGDLQVEYYIPSPEGIRIEIMGGVGRGDSRPIGTPGNGTYNEGTFYRYLLQGNVGYSTLDASSARSGSDDHLLFEFAAAMRAVYVSFDRLDQTVYGSVDDQGMPLPPVVTHLSHRATLIYEPAFILRIGTPLVQGETQIGFANNVSKNIDFVVNPVYISFGLRITFR